MTPDRIQKQEIATAQRVVDESLRRFETSLSHLEQRIDQSRRRVQNTVDYAKAPFVRARNLADEAKRLGELAIRRAQENPKPVVWGAAALLGGLLVISYLSRRRA